jgi:hypothetical protein
MRKETLVEQAAQRIEVGRAKVLRYQTSDRHYGTFAFTIVRRDLKTVHRHFLQGRTGGREGRKHCWIHGDIAAIVVFE